MQEMLRMIAVLSLICGLSGLTLAGLKQLTQPIIVEQVLNYVQAPALQTALPEHDNDPVKDRKTFEVDGRPVVVFPAMQSGRLVAVAMETFAQGYGGDIGVMTAFDVQHDRLVDVGMTTLKETPGLGMRVTEESFSDSFEGHALQPLELNKNGGDIDAVAGATISSTGVVQAVKEAVTLYKALKGEFAQTWS